MSKGAVRFDTLMTGEEKSIELAKNVLRLAKQQGPDT